MQIDCDLAFCIDITWPMQSSNFRPQGLVMGPLWQRFSQNIAKSYPLVSDAGAQEYKVQSGNQLYQLNPLLIVLINYTKTPGLNCLVAKES
jgi:hypothetical protein